MRVPAEHLLHLRQSAHATDERPPTCWLPAQSLLLLDQAGWHLSTKFAIPANITLMPLPSKARKLNPVENIWQFIRENWLSNRAFRSYDDILEH